MIQFLIFPGLREVEMAQPVGDEPQPYRRSPWRRPDDRNQSPPLDQVRFEALFREQALPVLPGFPSAPWRNTRDPHPPCGQLTVDPFGPPEGVFRLPRHAVQEVA